MLLSPRKISLLLHIQGFNGFNRCVLLQVTGLFSVLQRVRNILLYIAHEHRDSYYEVPYNST
jgi:hypothetical protein